MGPMTRRLRLRLSDALFRDLLAVSLLCGLVMVCLWRIALAGRVLAGGDVFTYFYPYWAEATRAVRAGRLPLWNPYLFMGVPFLANSQVGVFYPLNWPLWLFLPPHRSVHVTIVLHLCLAALNGYLWGRTSLHLSRVGAWTVGVVFALGGYLGAQVEHVNQLQGLAWWPLMLTLYDRAEGARSRTSFVALALVVAGVLLAGHTQTAFISLVGLATWALGPALWRAIRRQEWRSLIRPAALVVTGAGLGIALAAVQLIPTEELSRLSVRAQGLPFNERVSFSLPPLYLGRALLPAFTGAVPPQHIEHVAYVGVVGLVLSALGLVASAGRRPAGRPTRLAVCLLVVLGLFLSLGLYNPVYLLLARFVPGFAHFRVPARWLALYALGMAALAGWGSEALFLRRGRFGRRGLLILTLVLLGLGVWAAVGGRVGDGVWVGWPTVVGWTAGMALGLTLVLLGERAPRAAGCGLLLLLSGELLAAGSVLPHSRATAPQAFTSLRPAIAHLLAAGSGDQPAGLSARFISMSDVTFDPGDLPEIKVIYGPQLSAAALYDYVVAAKHKEVLSPDLPLAFGIPAVDGYDGGVLPLERYVRLQRLFLPEEKVSMDGRLRENLSAVPAGRWLNLFNVRYVITDKLHDAWVDDVFYDLQLGARLAGGESAVVAHVPRFEATALGIVSHLRGGEALPDEAVVGVVEIGFGGGLTRTFELRAGEHTAEGVYGPHVAHAPAVIGGAQAEGDDYVTRLRWSEPASPAAVAVRATLPRGELVVRGMSLIDERTGGFQALVVSDQGSFRLAHSGDVKIYENLASLERAFLVHEATVVADDGTALTLMQDAGFDPAAEVVLSEGEGAGAAFFLQHRPPRGPEFVSVTHYAPERVEIEVSAEAPGYLVLTDVWYPGWEATVDGEAVPVWRADLLFRAVGVGAGRHSVVFTFRPASVRIGAGVSLVAWVGLIGAVVMDRWLRVLRS